MGDQGQIDMMAVIGWGAPFVPSDLISSMAKEHYLVALPGNYLVVPANGVGSRKDPYPALYKPTLFEAVYLLLTRVERSSAHYRVRFSDYEGYKEKVEETIRELEQSLFAFVDKKKTMEQLGVTHALLRVMRSHCDNIPSVFQILSDLGRKELFCLIKLYDLASLLYQVTDEEDAKAWMSRQVKRFDGRRPIELVQNGEIDEVYGTLLAVAEGVYL